MNFFEKRISVFVIYSIVVLAIVLSACNDKPTDIGSAFIPTANIPGLTIISSTNANLITSDTVGYTPVSLISAGVYYIGKTSSMKFISASKFYNIPTDMNAFTTDSILSATLYMQVNTYGIGNTDSTLPFSFKVYELTGEVTSGSTSAPYDVSKLVASYNAPISYTSTSSVQIKMDFDKATLVKWLKLSIVTTASLPIYGIAFVPDDNCKVIRQFAGSQVADFTNPKTVVVFQYRRGGTDTTIYFTTLAPLFEASFIETVPPPVKTGIMVQGGIEYRTHLSFDVSMIPALASIHKAKLVLTLDSANSVWGNQGPDLTLDAQFGISDLFRSTTGNATVYYGYSDPNSTGQYNFDGLAQAIERWKRGDANNGLIIETDGSNQTRSLNKMVFFDAKCPDPTKRPKLTIIYSVQPK